jgi:iron complex transport system permease protein
MGILLAGMVITAVGMGYITIAPGDVLRILGSRIPGYASLTEGMNPLFSSVVWDVRLPRILTAAAVGAGLAGAGVVFQGILLNPLADPFTLGVSSGAAFGASLALLLGADFLGPYAVCVTAFAGAVITLLAVVRLSSIDGRINPTSLILSGVIVAAILSAGISMMKYLADEQVAVIVFWLMGSLVSKTWPETGLVFVFTLTGLVVCLFYARDLNLVCLGERSAQTLGVNTRRLRLILLITASLVSAACVSVAGIIGFVGLLIPHLLRMLVGPDHRYLLPASALAGGMLLLLADTVTRAILPHEVPIGVLTAVIGGPFFCWVFRRYQIGRLRGG